MLILIVFRVEIFGQTEISLMNLSPMTPLEVISPLVLPSVDQQNPQPPSQMMLFARVECTSIS